jgi:glucokinase
MSEASSTPAYALGIDIGGTKVSAALVSDRGEIVEYSGKPFVLTTEYDGLTQGAGRALELAVELGQDILAAELVSPAEVAVCGVGTPGVVDTATATIVVGAANIPGSEGVIFGSVLGPVFRLPVYAENDVNCAAYAEALFGAGREADPVLCITLGAGVGGGLVTGGRLYRGKRGAACEIGHTIVDCRGKLCRCGARGCLETEFSTEVIREELTEAATQYPESVFGRYVREGQALTARHLFMALEEGDPVADRIFDRLTDALAAAVCSAFRMVDPEVVVLGGGLMQAGDVLLETLRRKVQRQLVGLAVDGPSPLVPALLGAAGVVVGAAVMALREARGE